MGEGEGADRWGRAASEGGPRERESGEELTGRARWSVDGRGARFGPPGPEERGVAGARELGWNLAQPREGRGISFSFSYSNSFFLFLFYFCVFCFFFS